MILGFKEQFPWGGATHFEEKILRGIGRELYPPIGEPLNIKTGESIGIIESPGPQTLQHKIHTIRGLNFLIKVGQPLHMAYGVRTKNYRQFNTGIPELEKCTGKQLIQMRRIALSAGGFTWQIMVDGHRLLDPNEICRLIENDGLLHNEFDRWFFKSKPGTFTGYIIHWTDFKY